MRIKFEPRDVWIGLYWTRTRITTLNSDREHYTFYICILPCFPIIFETAKEIPKHLRHVNW